MIWFDNISSDDVKVIVQRYPNRQIPERKTETISIPGRNGDIVLQQDAFENVSQEYDIYISAKKEKLPTMVTPVVQWLMKKGYKRLEDSYDPEHYRMASFSGPVDIENFLNEFGTATITFNCMPQRWLKYGERPVTITGTYKMLNPTAFPAKPLIKVNGTGNGTLNIGGTAITLTGINGYVMLDSEMQNCYKGTENCNNKMTGDFPQLIGETQISFSGAITSVEITPRWYTI